VLDRMRDWHAVRLFSLTEEREQDKQLEMP
jgi:hypothetical protein